MNPQDILNKAVQALGGLGQKVANTPVLPFLPQQTNLKNILTNPMSLYAAYKQNPQEAFSGAIMGMATPVTGKKIGINQIDDAIDAIRNQATNPEDKIQAINDLTHFAKQNLNPAEMKIANRSVTDMIDSVIGKFTDPIKTTSQQIDQALNNNIGKKLDLTTPVQKAVKYLRGEQGKFAGSSPSTGGEIKASTTKSVIKQAPSRFKTGKELVNYIDQNGNGSVGVKLSQAELNQLKEHVMSLNTPENAKWQGTIYKNYGGGKDLILGVVQDPASKGFAPNAYSNMYIVATDSGYGFGKVRTHATPISPKDIIGKVDINKGLPQLGSGGEIPSQLAQEPRIKQLLQLEKRGALMASDKAELAMYRSGNIKPNPEMEAQAIKQFGITKDPKESLYITTKGDFLGHNGMIGTEHRNFNEDLLGLHFNADQLPKQTGMIETVYSPNAEYNVRIYTDPTPEQIETIKRVSKTVPITFIDDFRKYAGGKVKGFEGSGKELDKYLSTVKRITKK